MRDLMAQKKFLFTLGIGTPLHAKIVEKVGFDYVYMGGNDTSLTLLGLPDVGLITETEMVNNARNIAKAVSVPVIADGDTGYGNAINVIRTVEDFEAAGVAGIHIEDQVSPKRCGHVAGKMIIPLEEAVGKLKAALDARRDKDFIIMGRTDAIAASGGGIDEAVRRGKEFARIGCDVVWCEFPSADIEYPKRFAQEIHREFPGLPLYFNYSSNLKWHETPSTFDEIAELGYKAMHVSLAAMRVSMQATWDYAADLLARGAAAEIDFEKRSIGHPMGTFHQFAGFEKIKELESRYGPAEEVSKKYEKPLGL
jgi:isocitrate lyase